VLRPSSKKLRGDLILTRFHVELSHLPQLLFFVPDSPRLVEPSPRFRFPFRCGFWEDDWDDIPAPLALGRHTPFLHFISGSSTRRARRDPNVAPHQGVYIAIFPRLSS